MFCRLYPRDLALEHYIKAGRSFASQLINGKPRSVEDDERLDLWEEWERDIIRRGYRTRSFEDFQARAIQKPESIMKRAPDEEPIYHAVHFRTQIIFQADPLYGRG